MPLDKSDFDNLEFYASMDELMKELEGIGGGLKKRVTSLEKNFASV